MNDSPESYVPIDWSSEWNRDLPGHACLDLALQRRRYAAFRASGRID